MAVRELSSHGKKALPSLEEILNVTAYEDNKSACMNAIRSIKGKKDSQSASAATTDIKKRKKSKTRQRHNQD
jgi:hypothetical protein